MSIDQAIPLLRSLQSGSRTVGRRATRAERNRLAQQDRIGARLAELHCMRTVIAGATEVVTTGWVQHDWYVVTDERGQRVRVSAYDVHLVTGRPVAGACLVGALVYAAGGPPQAHSQLVQRTLDLTWHALHEDKERPVQWCPAPMVRTAHVRDLTRWNDHPARTVDEVTGLLDRALETTHAQTRLLQAR